jgi:hypothetical protein
MSDDRGEGRGEGAAIEGVDRPLPASGGLAPVLPYLGAVGLAGAVMAVLVAVTSLPVAGVVQVGLTFVAVALVARRLEDVPPDAGNRVLAWVAERLRGMGDRFGVEFYGLASLTAFLRAEAISLSQTEISWAELLDDPVVSAVTWLITEAIQSFMNAIWAGLWWLQLYREVVPLQGLGVFVAVIVAGWGVWRVLEITPRPRDPGLEGLDRGLEGLDRGLEGLDRDLNGLTGGGERAGRVRDPRRPPDP